MRCKVLLCFSLLSLIKLVSPVEIQANPNANATLPCNGMFPLPPAGDKSFIDVRWVRNGSAIASYSQAETHITGGFSWDSKALEKGDFSLTVLRASLSLQGLYRCTVSYNATAPDTHNVTLSVLAPPTLSVPQQWLVLEKESNLSCHASGFYPPPVSFTWTRDGKEISTLSHMEGEQRPDGFYMAVGYLSLHPTRQDQNVTYGCRVSHKDFTQELDLQLNITYLPSVDVSVVPSSSSGAALTLSCDVESFYPEEMFVSWLQNGSVLPDPPTTEKNQDGTYRTRRYYTLSSEQRERGGKVGCAVNQPGAVLPLTRSVDLDQLFPQNEPPVLTKSAKASVAMMCISLVLVFLLCFGFSWRRRDEKKKSLNVSGIILPPRVIVGQKGRVSLSVEGRRVDRVQTTWFLNDRPISDTSLTVSEKGPLLISRGQMGYYKLHTQGPLHSSGGGTQQLISSLTFIPQISIHKAAVFKCQVSYAGKDKVVAERVSEKFTILSAPEVSEIQLAETQNDSDVIGMTVRASHFHPDVITFRWFCQGGELSPVASQASSSPRPNSEGFFSAFSQCKLPRRELEKGSTKVWVSVHHIALKQPITRDTRGFIKRPVLSEIIASTSCPEQVLTLGCQITDFYPPNISVTWLKLRGGEQDDREEELMEGGELWGPLQSQPKLFRATAILKRRTTNQEKKERGGGIICRVEHCSLLEPVERVWRNMANVVPSIPPSISVCWSSEGVGVFSLLLKGGHPKAQLLWAAGGASLSPLVSIETEEIGDDGQRELRSVCALERSASPPGQNSKQAEKRKNGHATSLDTKAAVTDPDAKGIEYIDENVDGEMKSVDETKSELDEDSDKEGEEDQGALHINKVDLSGDPRDSERARLKVCVEIRHPEFKLPVYRTWTESVEEMSSSA